jgi:hypothetical protein
MRIVRGFAEAGASLHIGLFKVQLFEVQSVNQVKYSADSSCVLGMQQMERTA